MKKSIAICSLLLAAAAFAQPSVIMTGFPVSELSASGNVMAGAVYDASILDSRVIRATLGPSGFTVLDTGGIIQDGQVRMSNDGTAMSYGDYNYANLNNATNSITYNPNIPNMWERTSITYRWLQGGWLVQRRRCAQRLPVRLQHQHALRHLRQRPVYRRRRLDQLALRSVPGLPL